MFVSTIPNAISQRLLERAQQERFLSQVAAQRVRSLMEHGLHLEQTLLGTQLLTREQYGTLLQEISCLPWQPIKQTNFSRVFPAGLVREDAERWFILPLQQEEGHWQIGFVHPWDRRVRLRIQQRAQEQGWTYQPTVILFSDWRQSMHSSNPVSFEAIRLVREFLVNLERQISSSAYTNDFFRPRHEPFLDSAFQLRLAREACKRGFASIRFPQFNGSILHLERTQENNHPREWMFLLQEFLDRPEGILVIRRPDGSMKQWVDDHIASAESSDAWREQRPIAIQRASSTTELIDHAILLGQPIIVLEERSDFNWQSYTSEGTPVRLIESHPSPYGRAWSSYALSYVPPRSSH